MTYPKSALIKPSQVISQHELILIICRKRHHNKRTKKFRICKFEGLKRFTLSHNDFPILFLNLMMNRN